MSNENENEQIENNNEQIENQNQQVNTPDDTGTGNGLPQDLDKVIDDFISKADHAPAKAPENKGKETQTPQSQQNNNKQANDKGGNQNANANGTGANQNQSPQQAPTPPRKYGELFHQDQRGNIYNAKGELIAQQGAGHKLFRRLYPYIEKAETEVAAWKSKAENYERATQAARDAGLSLEEQSAALSLMTVFKKDAKAAINFLLQQAEGRGIDVSEIRGGATSFDSAALEKRLLDAFEEKLARFNPFVENLAQERARTEAQNEAIEIYNTFMEENPDAKQHSAAIAAVMDSYPQLSMEQAYFRLKTDALERGLDWRKPLAPQYEAISKRGNNNNREPNGDGNNHILPDLNGRTSSDTVVTHNRGEAGANDDWGSIIESAVADVRSRARQ